jgi:hypothetical protein
MTQGVQTGLNSSSEQASIMWEIDYVTLQLGRLKEAKCSYKFDETDNHSLLDFDGSYYNSMIAKEYELREKVDSLLSQCTIMSNAEKKKTHKIFGLTKEFLSRDGKLVVHKVTETKSTKKNKRQTL